MTREKWFVGTVEIEPDLFISDPQGVAQLVDKQIAREVRDMVGPRGGAWRAVGPVERHDSVDARGMHVIGYRVLARYVRPPGVSRPVLRELDRRMCDGPAE